MNIEHTIRLINAGALLLAANALFIIALAFRQWVDKQ
jgi:hypothetical protein